MPPSSKRPQRARRETINNVEPADSSPSRPAKRRKKADDSTERPAPPKKLPKDRSGLTLTDDEIIASVIAHFNIPTHDVQATKDLSDAVHEQHSKEGVQAYAKLAGKQWTFYVKMLKNIIGRPPEGSNTAIASNGLEGLSAEVSDPDAVHVDLGPSKMVSRKHAEIYFDGDGERWNIAVHGRNGIKINNEAIKRGTHQPLISGQVIEIGGVEMMFVLPEQDGSLQVQNVYLRRAGLIQPLEEGAVEEPVPSSKSALISPSQASARGQNGGPLPIAPAPPDYRRPGTPASARSKAVLANGKSPGYAGGTMLMNSDDIDLSLDSNKHIKPSYSYAQLISQAILDTPDEKLTLNGIYTFIQDKYAYYRHALGGGWQNSIRHNLSLNKAFQKIARTTDEPGKGMKWSIRPEFRDEMARNCVRGGRGGHRGSPGSPANHLGLLARASKDGDASSTPAHKLERSNSESPSLSTYASNGPQFTPDRGQLSNAAQDQLPGDGSPLPRHRRPHGAFSNAPGSPILSSSYMQEDGSSFITPAPHRVHPRLAPPSTAQRPSQHMPTSSPAPFWKYADITGSTPLAKFDLSPLKGTRGEPSHTLSSSPAPARRSSIPSPSRSTKKLEIPDTEEVEDEDVGFDLTRGFQSIGSYHAPTGSGVTTVLGTRH